MASLNRILIWYRNDLRLHDHQPLYQALQLALKQGGLVIPVYCLDPRQFSTTAWGFAKTGSFRAQFLIESLANLRANLQALGSDLVVCSGLPEQILPELVRQHQISALYYHSEVTAEEIQVETALKQALDIPCQPFWGHTLYHPHDLSFPISRLPELFTQFRKQVESSSEIQVPIPAPTQLPPLPTEIERGHLPTLAELGLTPVTPDPRGVLAFHGGESAGLARLEDYFWQQDCLKTYKETRNGLLGSNYSSKFSAWLALGCLSPRYIFNQVQAYERQRIKNDSTYWLMFELLWRDYFRFVCAKHGNAVFQQAGLRGVKIDWKQDPILLELWKAGQTGFPLVDANMRELAMTGFMSNRGRQNVASFLTKNLGIDWRWGAAYFESLLIDYDVCSNWGNWNYSAGIGNDARGFRFFNITKQAKDYDPNGDYVKYWCPELASLPASKVHEPWKLLPVEQDRLGLRLGVDYPHPVVDLFQSAAANEQVYNAAFGESIAPAKPRIKRSW